MVLEAGAFLRQWECCRKRRKVQWEMLGKRLETEGRQGGPLESVWEELPRRGEEAVG